MKNNIPELRFPEFEGEWEEDSLDNLLELKNGVNASKEQYGKGTPFINVLDILNNDYITYNNIVGLVDIDKKTLENNSVTYGDILFQRSSETREEVGTANVYLDSDKMATFGGFVIRGKKIGEYNPIFLNQLLKTTTARRIITSKAGGSTRYNIGQGAIAETVLLFPTLPEQEKIASFLTSIDEKISLLKGKEEALEQYKKGIMQQLFSQELRFKDNAGNDFPDWEEVRLKDILYEHKTRNKENLYEEVFSVAKEKGVVNQIEHLGRSYAADDVSNYKVIFPNDIVYTKSPTADFPYGIIKQNKTGRTGIVSTLYGVFKPTNEFVGLLLDYYFSVWENTFNYLHPVVEKGAKNTMNISNTVFLKGKHKLSFPTDEREQEKIASFLSSIDDKIALVQQELVHLEDWKRGLLQQMFV